MSEKSSRGKKGIANSGNCNVQSSGKTNYAESKWTVSAPTKGKDKQSDGLMIVSPVDKKAIINSGDGNVQASGETHYGSSQWTVKP